MSNNNNHMDITSRRDELVRVKYVLASMVITGCDDTSASAYCSKERAIETQLSEYEWETDFPPAFREFKSVRVRTDVRKRHSKLLAAMAEYFREEKYIFDLAK